MQRIIVKTVAILGFGLAGCHKCDLCCNVGGPCGSYSACGRGAAAGPIDPSGIAPSASPDSAPALPTPPAVPKNTTGSKPGPKPMPLQDSTSQAWR